MSIEYYNRNADDFFDNTCDVDMLELYKRFEHYLPKSSRILDAGCGSGRDTKYFLAQGYVVEAIDASEEMVKRARDFTGCDIKQQFFQEIKFENELDGIWSCASLLHVPKQDIPKVFKKFITALKQNGCWYMSFKYGEYERTKEGRLFNDYTEDTLQALIAKYEELHILELWLTEDRRPERDDKWINVLVKKGK